MISMFLFFYIAFNGRDHVVGVKSPHVIVFDGCNCSDFEFENL